MYQERLCPKSRAIRALGRPENLNLRPSSLSSTADAEFGLTVAVAGPRPCVWVQLIGLGGRGSKASAAR